MKAHEMVLFLDLSWFWWYHVWLLDRPGIYDLFVLQRSVNPRIVCPHEELLLSDPSPSFRGLDPFDHSFLVSYVILRLGPSGNDIELFLYFRRSISIVFLDIRLWVVELYFPGAFFVSGHVLHKSGRVDINLPGAVPSIFFVIEVVTSRHFLIFILR